jgi:hypothetical protein
VHGLSHRNEKLPHRDIFQATRAVWATEGLSGFYCGYSIQVNCLVVRLSEC